MDPRSHVPAIIELYHRGTRLKGRWRAIHPNERDEPLPLIEDKARAFMDEDNVIHSPLADEFRIVYWDDPRFSALGNPHDTDKIWEAVSVAEDLGYDEIE